MSETTLPAPFVELPPTQAELPYDDGEPMESPRHKAQMDLLIDALIPWLEQREDGFVGGNMFVYYSLAQVRNKRTLSPHDLAQMSKLRLLTDLKEQKRGLGLSLAMSGIVVLSGLGHLGQVVLKFVLKFVSFG